jgi:outer membrane lipoprotein carrier protein
MDRAKYWFRHRRLTTSGNLTDARTADFRQPVSVVAIGVVIGCLFAGLASGQPEAAPPDLTDASAAQSSRPLPPALADFLETVASFRAQFIQEVWSDDQRLIDVAEGSVEVLRPGRFRWHYDEPYEQLIVADGETLWMYDVDISQVTRSSLDENAAGNPGALLSGDSDVMDGFDVVASGSDAEETWVTLAPKLAQSDYTSIRVAFANGKATGTLSELEFVDGLDQTTVIRFLDAEVNPEISPDQFLFEVPADAHVLGGPG